MKMNAQAQRQYRVIRGYARVLRRYVLTPRIEPVWPLAATASSGSGRAEVAVDKQ